MNSKVVFRGRLIRVRVDRGRTVDGQRLDREVVEHPGAAVILPLVDRSQCLLVRQYRYPIKAMTWELPAGTLRRGEGPLACARRELEEETGFRARRWRKLLVFYPTPGYCTERMTVFVASELSKGAQALDADEDIRVKKVSFREAVQWIGQGKIQDAKTLAALLFWLQGGASRQRGSKRGKRSR